MLAKLRPRRTPRPDSRTAARSSNGRELRAGPGASFGPASFGSPEGPRDRLHFFRAERGQTDPVERAREPTLACRVLQGGLEISRASHVPHQERGLQVADRKARPRTASRA